MQVLCRSLRLTLFVAALLPAVAAADPLTLGWPPPPGTDPEALGWPQPGGPGSDLVITYSYSNLFDGSFLVISPGELRAATEEALGLWAAHAPLHFIEIADSGPPPSDTPYSPEGHPQIRIGHHAMPDLGHSFFPHPADGRAGDIHLDSGTPWTLGTGRWNVLEVLAHELGHALGLVHVDSEPAIMNPFFPQARFFGLGTSFLLPRDIAMLQTLYGEGIGSVQPMDPVPEPGTLLLVAAGLSVLARRHSRRHH